MPKKQARIDSGAEVIVGVNKYRPKDGDGAPFDVLEVDNTAVRDAQIARLKKLKATRDAAAVTKALAELKAAAKDGRSNLLEAAIAATRARATLGEVSEALAEVFGRHAASTHAVSAVYAAAYRGDAFSKAKAAVDAFARSEGRRPRILVVKLGQDGHDRGSKVIATGLADLGFDVDIGPLFQTPDEAAKQAIENDVHVIGVSSQAAAHKTLVPSLAAALKAAGADDVLIVVGGIIPTKDYDMLKAAGAAAVFGPGTPVPDCALQIVAAIEAHRRGRP
jgi:methylmalonyl-CoA mutase